MPAVDTKPQPQTIEKPKSYSKDGITLELPLEDQVGAKYPHYLPVWDKSAVSEKQLPIHNRVDPGTRADPSFPNLFPKGVEFSKTNISPHFGSEVRGIQLSQLSDKAKDELSLFVAQRGVVAFRNQDLKELSIDDSIKFANYFGPQHIHPTSGAPAGYPQIHLVHRYNSDDLYEDKLLRSEYAGGSGWHSDVSYETQPPSTTFLVDLEGPYTGGDTVYADTVQAYKRLSPAFRERLRGLRALHSGHEQVQSAISRGGVVRKPEISSFHPIVRTIPSTGEKALFVNRAFTRYIEGYKKDESEYLLKFLYDITGNTTDLQIRVKWEEGTVAVWDNRRTIHSASYDWLGGRRHLYRLTPLAEIPYDEDEEKSK